MSAKSLFILHGWAIDDNNQAKWDIFTKLLGDKLKKMDLDLNIFFLSIPGLTTKLDAVWTLDDYAVWLESQLDKYKQNFNNSSELILLGHSFGGQLALRFNYFNPKLISKLILIDSAGIKDRSFKMSLKRFVFGNLAKFGKLFFGDKSYFRKILYKIVREKDYYQASKNQRVTMTNVINDEIIDELGWVTCPTLILWGKHDKTTPVKNAKIFEQKITNSQLRIIDGARHSPQFTHPKQIAEIVGEFIGTSVKN